MCSRVWDDPVVGYAVVYTLKLYDFLHRNLMQNNTCDVCYMGFVKGCGGVRPKEFVDNSNYRITTITFKV